MEMKKFDFNGHHLRTVVRDGEPWFVGKDVAEMLGYRNPAEAVRDHCKHAELLKTSKTLLLNNSPRGLLIIPESDLYRLVMHSRLPQAEAFEEWVVGTVLPAIRKTGGYVQEIHPEGEQDGNEAV